MCIVHSTLRDATTPYTERCTQANETMKIEKANRTDANKITDLTIRSKDFWNYGAEQIAQWKDDLTITSEYIDKNEVFKLSIEKEIIGFYAFNSENKSTVKLNFLFLEPNFIGKGYGKILLNDFLKRMNETDYEKVTLDADPNAEQFYARVGFKVVGKLKSSIKDRYLPIMEKEIKPAYNTV